MPSTALNAETGSPGDWPPLEAPILPEPGGDVVYLPAAAGRPITAKPSGPLVDQPRDLVFNPRPRRIRRPLILFLLTCLSTWFAGAAYWVPVEYIAMCVQELSLDPLRRTIYTHGLDGFVFMVCVISILLAHEMGHFVFTVIYGVRSSFPYFLPMPIAPVGTMGAVIAMDGRNANRREIFDIGIAGPLAGLVIAAPIMLLGVLQLNLQRPASGGMGLYLPWAAQWCVAWLHPGQPVEDNVVWLSQANPCFIAGWFGLLMTALNMMPVSQLDGGHIAYTLFGKLAHWLARGLMVFIIAYITYTGSTVGILMVVMVLAIGTDHPPTSDDRVPLGPVRWLLGLLSFAIPILCFHPRVFLLPN